mmetsp:Transcript_9134/g.8961  ORF Transcript_9134/g.8961 Transcript_9134/m.8961 type:complete len:238 (-) Transcript_9134:169-882(-)
MLSKSIHGIPPKGPNEVPTRYGNIRRLEIQKYLLQSYRQTKSTAPRRTHTRQTVTTVTTSKLILSQQSFPLSPRIHRIYNFPKSTQMIKRLQQAVEITSRPMVTETDKPSASSFPVCAIAQHSLRLSSISRRPHHQTSILIKPPLLRVQYSLNRNKVVPASIYLSLAETMRISFYDRLSIILLVDHYYLEFHITKNESRVHAFLPFLTLHVCSNIHRCTWTIAVGEYQQLKSKRSGR